MIAPLLSPSRAAVLFSIKVFLASMLAYWIALQFNLERPYWAMGTVYIVSNPLSGVSTSKAYYRLIGTVLGGIATVVFVPNLAYAPELLSLVIALWVGGCLFISLLDRTPKSYIFMLAGYTVTIAGLPIVDAPDTAFSYAISRIIEIGIGVICAALVNRIVFPSHAGPVLYERVKGWLSNASDLTQATLEGKGSSSEARAEQRKLAADAVDMRAFSINIGYDTSHHRDLYPFLRALQHRMIRMLPLISGISDQMDALRQLGPIPAAVDALLKETAAWLSRGATAEMAEGEDLLRRARAMEQEDSPDTPWQTALISNLAYRLAELIEVWLDCRALHDNIQQSSSPSPRSAAVIAAVQKPVLHRDYFMAAVAGGAASVSILVACAFWIASGWSGGQGVAQLAGVFCCILAGLDNIVPALRKFLTFTLYSIVAAFLMQFLILPNVTEFLPMIACLGLVLIPSGIFLTIPSHFMLGMCMCVNFLFIVMPTAKLSLDFQTFASTNLAMVLAVLCAIVVCNLMRSIGAEAHVARLTRQAWRRISEIPLRRRPISHDRLSDQLVDVLGLIVPRLASLPAEAGDNTTNLLRDLRAGLNLTDIRHARVGLSRPDRDRVNAVLSSAADYYRNRGKHPDAPPTEALRSLDACLAETRENRNPHDGGISLRNALIALRICLTRDPLPAHLALPAPEVPPSPENDTPALTEKACPA